MLFVFLSDLQIAVRFLLLSFWKHFLLLFAEALRGKEAAVIGNSVLS